MPTSLFGASLTQLLQAAANLLRGAYGTRLFLDVLGDKCVALGEPA